MDEQPDSTPRQEAVSSAANKDAPAGGTSVPPVAARTPVEPGLHLGFVPCAPYLSVGFALWSLAYLLRQWARHRLSFGNPSPDQDGWAAFCFAIGTVCLAVGIAALFAQIDAVGRARHHALTHTPPGT